MCAVLMLAGFVMYLFIYQWRFAPVLFCCFLIGVTLWWVYSAPRNIPCPVTFGLGNNVVLYFAITDTPGNTVLLCCILQLQSHWAMKLYCVVFCNYSHTGQWSCIVLDSAITGTLGNEVVMCCILQLQSHLAMKRYCVVCAVTVTLGNKVVLRCILQLQSYLAIKLYCVVFCNYSHTWQ